MLLAGGRRQSSDLDREHVQRGGWGVWGEELELAHATPGVAAAGHTGGERNVLLADLFRLVTRSVVEGLICDSQVACSHGE